MAKTREDYLFLAKVSEQAERYDEMLNAMKSVANMKTELSVEERNLFSVAYKNLVGTRRSSWRVLVSIEVKEGPRLTAARRQLLQNYRKNIETELHALCNEVLSIIDTVLLPVSLSQESKVFFYKMRGDYFRYLAETTSGDGRTDLADKSLTAYLRATEFAHDLPPTHPIRLGLALNFSVFYFEIVGNSDKACNLAKEAFDDAIAELDNLSEDSYKDSTVIMQLLRDNLTLWTSDMAGDGEKDTDETTAE